jgi:hypothetical protein
LVQTVKSRALLDAATRAVLVNPLRAADTDTALLKKAADVRESASWDAHCAAVSDALRAPQIGELRVAKLRPQFAGLFEPRTRTIYLDCEAAAAVLDCVPGTFDHTTLHELVHAAQTMPTKLPGLRRWSSRLDRWLFEGATDVMAADIDHEGSVATRPLDLPERHGRVYGPYEAVTKGILAAVSTPESYRETLRHYVLLPYGEHVVWLRRRLRLGRWAVSRRRTLSRKLYKFIADATDESEPFKRMMEDWRLAEETQHLVHRFMRQA